MVTRLPKSWLPVENSHLSFEQLEFCGSRLWNLEFHRKFVFWKENFCPPSNQSLFIYVLILLSLIQEGLNPSNAVNVANVCLTPPTLSTLKISPKLLNGLCFTILWKLAHIYIPQIFLPLIFLLNWFVSNPLHSQPLCYIPDILIYLLHKKHVPLSVIYSDWLGLNIRKKHFEIHNVKT